MQLLRVDGQSLVGITQERAAEIMMHTGQVVELEVAKQGAIFHGLATLLSQPSPVMSPRSAGQVGPGPNKVTQSKSMSAMPTSQTAFTQQQHEQHTYQNHRPDYPPPSQGGGSMGPQGPHPPPPSAINANRSTSVGNLTIPRYVVTSNNKYGNQILQSTCMLASCFYFSTGFEPIFCKYIKRICRNLTLQPNSS